ncbi:MAG: ParB/RepB/Spo0J family partition protein [Oscillospiraceae bacterium]|nr:ParB/RepB/Spo0J family partition protein [Oscillospiraceae bacterium]
MTRTRNKTLIDSGRVLFIPVGSIRPNPSQPRRVFDEAALQELAASIAQYGILQPLTVRKSAFGAELVAGERRLRAAKLAGLAEVPCIVICVDDEDSGMLALVENLQRRDLDFIEEAEGLARLMRQYHLSQEQAARRIGKSQSAVANKLRLLKLPQRVLDALREHNLSERHARALLRLANEDTQLQTVEKIADGDWTVAKTEQYIESVLFPPAPKREIGAFLLRDARVFLNTVHHHLSLVRKAGIGACSEQQENEREIVLTIRIPKQQAK